MEQDYIEERSPAISKSLVDYLERVLPPVDHKPEDALSDIMFNAGKREVVNFLKQLHLTQKR
tara:strand:+ start:1062 stop:1247 length:186 start_codon:yes stop_codon:yes gene_type:complete